MKKVLMPRKTYAELKKMALSEGRTPEVILEKMFNLYEWYHNQEGNRSGDAGAVHYAGKDSLEIKSSAEFRRGSRKSEREYHLATRAYGEPKPKISRESLKE